MQVLEHDRHLHGVVAIVRFGQVAGRAHPLQIGPRRKIAARACDEHDPHAIGRMQGFKGFAKRCDHLCVESIVLFAAVDDDGDSPFGRGVDAHEIGLSVGVGNLDERISDRIGHAFF